MKSKADFFTPPLAPLIPSQDLNTATVQLSEASSSRLPIPTTIAIFPTATIHFPSEGTAVHPVLHADIQLGAF